MWPADICGLEQLVYQSLDLKVPVRVSTVACGILKQDIHKLLLISTQPFVLLVDKSNTSFGRGKGGKVFSTGWPVKLCDPV